MAQLVVSSGVNAGRAFVLSRDVTRLGRHDDNNVVLDDPSVSRFHAQVFHGADGYYLRDVASSKGTYVNGVRASGETRLADGDVIRLGRTEIILALSESAAAASPSDLPAKHLGTCVFADRAEPLDEKSIMVSISATGAPSAGELSNQRLGMLARVAAAIESVFDLDELLGTLLDVIVNLFHPDRGVILLCEPPGGPVVPKVVRPQQGDFTISRTIIDYAIKHKTSLLVANTMKDIRFSDAASITSQSIRAAICSPLICKEKILGVLYIDTQGERLDDQRHNVALLNLIAANAAIAIENAILIREKHAATRLAADEPGPLVAHSAAMRQVQERIAGLSSGWAPVLITGESGTGKLFAAKTIHKTGDGRDKPFLQVDCTSLVGEEGCKTLFGSRFAEALGESPTLTSAGPPTDGLWQRAAGGTLVLRQVDALEPAAQEVLSRFLQRQTKGDEAARDTRILATSSEGLSRLAKDGRFLTPLVEQLSADSLQMPRLRDRKEDVLPLAQHFLSRADQQAERPRHQFNASAERLLGSLHFRHGNVAELREAVEFAAVIAGGAEIGAEHIFTGPKDKGHRIELDLGQTPLVPWLSRPTVANLLQTLVLLFFLGIAALCLAAGGTLAGQVANALVWGLWWPGLMVLFLFVGRVWCPFCPISKAGRIFRALGGLDRPPPDWIKKHTAWIMALLFFAIVWSEHVFKMTRSPAATGVLLLTLMAFCAVLSLVYARETWCRYVCPLGSLSAGYSVASPIHVHSNPSICGTQCKTHECFKGSASESGCPMFHHPLYARDAHFCKVCLACVRTCPNQSAKVYLRPPLQAIWRSGDLSVTLVPLCLVASLLALVMLASHRLDWALADAMGFTAAGALVLAASFALGAVLPRVLSRDGNPALASRAAFALLLCAWGPLMAFHLANIPGLEALRIRAAADSFWTRLVPSLDLSILTVLQVAAVALSVGIGMITLWRIRVHSARDGAEILPWGWRALLAAAVFYLAAAVSIIIVRYPAS